MQAMYGYIYTPNQDISDEIYEGYGDKNIIDYLFDKARKNKDNKQENVREEKGNISDK